MLAERQLVKGHIKEEWFALLFSLESMKITGIITISDRLLFGQTASSSDNTITRAFLDKDNHCISVNLLSLTCAERYKKMCSEKKIIIILSSPLLPSQIFCCCLELPGRLSC